jgi:putative transposase
MRKSTETQIVAILKAHDAGTPTAELARKHRIHPNTLRLWRAKYRGNGLQRYRQSAAAYRSK